MRMCLIKKLERFQKELGYFFVELTETLFSIWNITLKIITMVRSYNA